MLLVCCWYAAATAAAATAATADAATAATAAGYVSKMELEIEKIGVLVLVGRGGVVLIFQKERTLLCSIGPSKSGQIQIFLNGWP